MAERNRIITIANQRVALARRPPQSIWQPLAAIGERVLIIDLDPQGNAALVWVLIDAIVSFLLTI